MYYASNIRYLYVMDIRTQIDLFKNFKPIFTEAVKTECQTKDAVYDISIGDDEVNIKIKIPFKLQLDEKEAKLLEDNLHNVIELVLKPYFK